MIVEYLNVAVTFVAVWQEEDRFGLLAFDRIHFVDSVKHQLHLYSDRLVNDSH